MKDSSGDQIEVEAVAGTRVTVGCLNTGGDYTYATLSAKKARKLARKLLDAANELDGGEPVGPPSPEKRVGDLERGWSRVLSRLDALEGEQRWQSEQIKALLLDLGTRRETYGKSVDGEDHTSPVCLRCEVPIYASGGQWLRESTGSAICPRNPARDGHEPRPAAAPASPNATPADDEAVHYLLSSDWIVDSINRLGVGREVTFLLPNGVTLRALRRFEASTGFDR